MKEFLLQKNQEYYYNDKKVIWHTEYSSFKERNQCLLISLFRLWEVLKETKNSFVAFFIKNIYNIMYTRYILKYNDAGHRRTIE